MWRIFADIPLVAACLPGAVLTEHDASSAKGTMTVKLGPITAAFSGSAAIERDDAGMRGTIRGAGNDRGTGSRTRGDVLYRLVAEDGGATRVFITVEYTLAGTLAQFSRTSLAQDLGRRLVAEFADSLNSRLAGTAQRPRRRPALRSMPAVCCGSGCAHGCAGYSADKRCVRCLISAFSASPGLRPAAAT